MTIYSPKPCGIICKLVLKITLSLLRTRLLLNFTFSLGANIDNVATTKTISKNYNPVTNTLERNLNKNLTGYSTFSTSASLQTVLYGMLKFGEKSKIQAIRHMVTPSIGFTYSPDFGDPKFGYFKSYYDERGVLTTYSIFEGGMFGSPNQGLTQSIGFNINNNSRDEGERVKPILQEPKKLKFLKV